jgi:steroid delta-isomerase-like uncharacterized protein
MSIQDNLKLDEENFAAWNAHDVDRALAVLSDDIVWQDVSRLEPLRGKDAARQYIQAWFSDWPDIQVTVTNRVVTEDQVAGELDFTATNTVPLQLAPGAPTIPPTGKKIAAKGTYFVRYKNGKAVEVHTYPDTAGLLMQLGLMPLPGS